MEAEEEVVGGGAKVSPQRCEKKKNGFESGSKQPRGSSACMSTDLSIPNALMMSIVVEGWGGQEVNAPCA